MYTCIFIWCFRLVFFVAVVFVWCFINGRRMLSLQLPYLLSICKCRIYTPPPRPYTSPLGLVPKLCCYCYAIPARAAHTRPPLRLCPTQGTLLSQRVTPFWHGLGPENVTFLKSSRCFQKMLTSLHRKESTPDSPAVSLTGVNNSTVDRCMHRQHACCLGMLAAWHPVSDACDGPQPHPQRIGGPARASTHVTWHGPGGGCIGSTGYLFSPTPPTLLHLPTR